VVIPSGVARIGMEAREARAGVGTGAGRGAGTGTGTCAGTGAGTGRGTGAGTGAGAGRGAGAGTGAPHVLVALVHGQPASVKLVESPL
jgi:hypothetical protein